ncbi:MAG: hypothetical protein OZ928_20400 [Polyangiaceae bacterium]|nr:hypothetical protein [Polyangiaceae bacterium]
MRHISFAAGILLALTGCVRGPNITTDQLELRRVVIYRNGVGYFERAGHVEADEVTFKMRQRMVGDFLATLAIVEHGGSSVRSASFPLDVDDDQPEPPPIDPRMESLLKPLPVPPVDDTPDPEKLRKVVLRLDGASHDLVVGYVAETPVWRPSYRVVVGDDGADLQAWGIVQNLSGEDWKDVKLALVAGAPLAFESTLGEPVVPARPIVTDTGEVIAAVPTGETSLAEAPATETDRYGGESEAKAAELEDDSDGAPSGGGGGVGQGMGRAAARAPQRQLGPAGDRAAPPAPPMPKPVAKSKTDRVRAAMDEARARGPSAPRNLSALAAVAVDAGTTRYEIPTAVTVPDKSATMVLLLSKRVPGQAVFLFAPDGGVPDSASHPFRVARFTNKTAGLLERGPIAVFEKGSFLGQGLLDPLPPGATATVPFALERSLAVESERKYEQQGARLHSVEAGQLTIERDQVMKTLYKLKNGGDRLARVLVKHPRVGGARLFKPPAGTEDNTGTGSALVPVEVRPHARAELTVDERQSTLESVDWLSPLAEEAVRAYLADSRSNPESVKQLTLAWQSREGLRKSTDELEQLVTEQRELENDSDETRRNLRAIEKNTQAADLRAKLTRRLGELSTRLEQLTKRLVELRMTVSEQQVRFRDAIRGLKIAGAPPPKD